MRAARMLWAKIIKSFAPKNNKSMALRTHCQTSGWSLTAQDPFNNVTRTAVEALAAVCGGTQSLHTNALDEALALPTEFSARIARNTQLFLQHETQVTRSVDPWAGSFELERRTKQLMEKAWALIEEIEALGGMTKAIENGMPKLRIEQAAARKQARIDSGAEIIVGVNKHQRPNDEPLHILRVDQAKVLTAQLKKLNRVKQERDQAAVQIALDNLTQAAKTDGKNLLALAITAAKQRATLGEISEALVKEFGRYQAQIQTFSGVYKKEISNDQWFEKAQKAVREFALQEGRQPRIMVAKMGQDGHDRGAKVVATGYADLGFDVDVGPLFQTPEETAKQAVENDVHFLGVSSLAAGHMRLVPQVIQALADLGRRDIMVIVGGVIPEDDHKALYEAGVVAIYGPGTNLSQAALELIEILMGTSPETNQ